MSKLTFQDRQTSNLSLQAGLDKGFFFFKTSYISHNGRKVVSLKFFASMDVVKGLGLNYADGKIEASADSEDLRVRMEVRSCKNEMAEWFRFDLTLLDETGGLLTEAENGMSVELHKTDFKHLTRWIRLRSRKYVIFG